jgi:hypothetical protein
MTPKPDHAFQRKRPRFRRNGPSGVAQPGTADHAKGTGPADSHAGDDDHSTPDTMEARSLDAEAAYEFAAQHNEHDIADRKAADKKQESAPASAPANAPSEASAPSQPVDPQTARREQERMRREAEREKRDAERRDRERREQERRDQQRREQERRERDRLMELRNLDVDGIVSKAWEIFGAEVKEEGVELFPDNDARELAKRAFRLAEIFLLEESRLRRLRAEPLPGEQSESNGSDSAPASNNDASADAPAE